MFERSHFLLRNWFPSNTCLLLAVALLISIFGCGGGSSGTGSYSTTSTKRVFGSLVAPSGKGISGVRVTDQQGGASTSTDENGDFSLETDAQENAIELEIESMGTVVDVVIEGVPEEAAAVELAVEFDAPQSQAQVTSVEFSEELPPEDIAEEDTTVRTEPINSIPLICSDDCGDGLCAETVCLGEGCSCQESAATCPQDCPIQQECLPLCGDGQCTEERDCSTINGQTICPCIESISSCPEDCDPNAPEIPACEDTCGDGFCAENVCLALGCPCAETHNSCPQDCSAPQECFSLCGDGQCAEEQECSVVDGQTVCYCAENAEDCPQDCGVETPVVPVCVDYCGDGLCAEAVCLAHGCACAESHSSCPQDCPAPPSCTSLCGDGQCTAEESCSIIDGQTICSCSESVNDCPEDCEEPITNPSCTDNCGDGFCTESVSCTEGDCPCEETANSCPQDCSFSVGI